MFLNQSPNLGKIYRWVIGGQELSQKLETDLLQKIFRKVVYLAKFNIDE
jgi:hypothetical protein